jgi:hypothetical protein
MELWRAGRSAATDWNVASAREMGDRVSESVNRGLVLLQSCPLQSFSSPRPIVKYIHSLNDV